MREEFLATIRTFMARKGRTIMTALGIVIGIAGVVMIASLGAGAQDLVVRQITKLGSNLVGVLPGASDESGPPAAVFGVQVTTLTLRDVDALRDTSRVPHLTAVAPFVRGQWSVSSIAGTSVDTYIVGTEGSYPRVQNAPLSAGRFFTDEEGRSGARVAVLGSAVVDALFPDGREPLDATIKVKGIPLRVIGVMKEQGTVFFQNQDDQVFVPTSIAQRELLGINYVQFIRAKVSDSVFIPETIVDMKQVLRENHKIVRAEDDDFSVRDLAQAVSVLTAITDGFRAFLGLMAGIALLVGGIGIMNIMLVSVTERTREIGLRKALGATPARIRNQFLVEAGVITLIGGVLGVGIGIFLAWIITEIAAVFDYGFAFIVPLPSVLLALGVSSAIGIIFGWYPARKASLLDPIEALRYE